LTPNKVWYTKLYLESIKIQLHNGQPTIAGVLQESMKIMNLRQMKKNQSGTITTITASGELGRRIRDMGLVPGTFITVRGRAPLYDPVALKVMGFTLTLRNNEADYVMVEVD
jgi:ferrous iron transport protein A